MTASHSATSTALDADYPLDPAAVAAYRRDGYVRLEGVLASSLLDEVCPVLRGLVHASTADAAPLDRRGTYGRAFLQVMNLWQRDPRARAFVFARRLAGIAARLMEVDGVRLYHDQALAKEAGGGATPWHCDQRYWPLEGDRTITAWIPLQDTPLAMGPLAFCPGSHRLDLGRDLAISDASEAAIGQRVRLSDLPVDERPYRCGDVSFHAGWTFHRAGSNRTDRIREVMTVIYVADGIRVAEPLRQAQRDDLAQWMPGAQVGQPLDTPLNPVLWRKDTAGRP